MILKCQRVIYLQLMPNLVVAVYKKTARFSFTRLGILITVIVLSLFAKNHSVAARPLLGNHIAPIRQNACRC